MQVFRARSRTDRLLRAVESVGTDKGERGMRRPRSGRASASLAGSALHRAPRDSRLRRRGAPIRPETMRRAPAQPR
jgi:hypothetical protein